MPPNEKIHPLLSFSSVLCSQWLIGSVTYTGRYFNWLCYMNEGGIKFWWLTATLMYLYVFIFTGVTKSLQIIMWLLASLCLNKTQPYLLFKWKKCITQQGQVPWGGSANDAEKKSWMCFNFFSAMQLDIIRQAMLHWQITYMPAHIPGRLLCDMNSVFPLFMLSSLSRPKLKHLGNNESSTNLADCALLTHPADVDTKIDTQLWALVTVAPPLHILPSSQQSDPLQSVTKHSRAAADRC